MLTFIFILGLLIILWPFIGSIIASLSGWIIMAVSLAFYWLLRLFNHPATPEEDEKLTKISSGISMVTVVTLLFALLIWLAI